MSDLISHALVTGAGKRLGRSMALRLARLGFDVTLHARERGPEVEEAAAAIRAAGRRAGIVAADLLNEAEVEQVLPLAGAALGPVGLLVNSAAIFELDRLLSMTADSFQRHVAINLRAPLLLMQGYARQLPAASPGLIVNIIDERVLNLTANYLSYSIAKAGLWAATQVLARQLAPRIRVNAIGPGLALAAPGWSEARFRKLTASMPLQRGTTPDEIADALAFIIGARALTGHLIPLDGGQHMGWLTAGGPPRE